VSSTAISGRPNNALVCEQVKYKYSNRYNRYTVVIDTNNMF